MVDQNTDFFKITDNFTKIANVPSIQVIKSDLDFIPKVTVAIPTFRRPILLKEALDSAINQKGYEKYDIIVVDNDPERGCETEKLIGTFNNKRITYYKNSENVGMAGNWNRLFQLAIGEYVIMLHDDDLLLPECLVKMMGIVDTYRNIYFLKPAFSVVRGKEIVRQCDLPPSSKGLVALHWFSFYNGNILGAPVGVLFNKSSFLSFGGFDETYYPSIDFHYFLKYARYADVWYYDDCLALYRYSENESLNLSTLNGFIDVDSKITRQILKSFKIPEFIIRSFLNYKVSNTIKLYKNILNVDFELDKTRINWTLYEDRFHGPLSSAFLQCVNYFFRIGIYVRLLALRVKILFNGLE
jgi:glycosyltransferase involved in cell wall biosynthesis